MKFKYKESEWRIRFKHTETKTTFAYLEFWNETTQQWKLFVYGSTICSESDRFEKEVGRKIALQRLTKKIHLLSNTKDKKEIRKFKSLLWATYNNRQRKGYKRCW